MSSPPIEPVPLRARKQDAAARGGKTRARYRACLVCSYVQPSPDWMARGCPNCEAIVRVAGSQDQIKKCTSIQFDGVIAVLRPKESWVARWQRNVNHVPGLYAVRVIGRPPTSVIQRIQQSGVPYIPRDDVAGDHSKEDEDDEDEDADEDEAGGKGGDKDKDMDEFEDDGMIVDDDDDVEEDDRIGRRVGGRDDDRDRGIRSPEDDEDYDD
ncbi:hypothetical protein FFLO_01700 [Filobasidium floriforme]|uniref:Transcription elongation factor SPT4 n=1 Tax=Filobasidium floriforme TaxID=5210 RepID=A0A8K0JU68_9TREE|nr:Spt4/RpoE2 zinc finger-domain-containing protein [Filobasidium floriforme]KAG7562871.1 hypothetical protein FFLO_01700 [Filobasidium floriforme]KAH8086440.1 Spt4/RpoE2 zinc finger-domain-containing protein [Filobasidium floriforme]